MLHGSIIATVSYLLGRNKVEWFERRIFGAGTGPGLSLAALVPGHFLRVGMC